MQAKVFISCGQSASDKREIRIARRIGELVRAKGFEDYLAINQQDAKSFRENIFRELSGSEYFLFVDLKRELLPLKNGKQEHRGSLFCHQEMAIASFLEIEPAYFHDVGVSREGLGNYIQSNSEPFESEDQLYKKIEEQLKLWRHDWKNALKMEVAPRYPSVAAVTNNQARVSAWYHIHVCNLHHLRHAKNCFVFLDSYVKKATGEVVRPKTVELHWAAFDFPSATILPKSWRAFDAFLIYQDTPDVAIAYSFSTSTEYYPAILKPGEYDFTYRVVSDNFPEMLQTFSIRFKGGHNGIEFISPGPISPPAKDDLFRIATANATTVSPVLLRRTTTNINFVDGQTG